MACEQYRGNLDRYLDGELAPAEAAALSAHLRSCPQCSNEVLERVQIKRAVHTAGSRYTASAALRNRITKDITSESSGGSTRRWSWILIPAMAALLAAFFLSAYIDRERVAQQRVYSELADLHVATLASSTPVDVVSSDRHTVKPWFQGKIPFTFNLPELAGTEFVLIGGRVFYLEQTPGAHLIFQLRKHDISVFILPTRAEEIRNLPSGTGNASSFNTETWTQNGLRYFVVGDTNVDDLRALSKLLRNAG